MSVVWGGAPAGPPALGLQIVVSKCSDQMTYQTMAQIHGYRTDRLLGLLRRVQPHLDRGVVCGVHAVHVHLGRHPAKPLAVLLQAPIRVYGRRIVESSEMRHQDRLILNMHAPPALWGHDSADDEAEHGSNVEMEQALPGCRM